MGEALDKVRAVPSMEALVQTQTCRQVYREALAEEIQEEHFKEVLREAL